MLYHYGIILPYPPLAALILRHGSAGVDLFFVLSGFVLTYNYAETFRRGLDDYRSFLQARVARIVPMNIVALLLITPVTLFILTDTGAGRVLPWTAVVASWVANLTLVQSWMPALLLPIWDAPAGSVSDEFFFYLLFPFLARYALARLRSDNSVVWAAIATLASSATLLVMLIALLGPALAAGLAYVLPPFRFGEFALGAVGGMFYLNGQEGRSRLSVRLAKEPALRERAVLYAIVLFIVLCALLPAPADAMLYLLQAPLALALIVALASGPTRLGQLLSHPKIVLLGEASYSLYLLHIIPLEVLSFFGGVRPGNAAVLWWAPLHQSIETPVTMLAGLALIPMTVLASVMGYRYIELPARRALRPKR